jgi:4-amino-4-deoxy-L-arabinose transferase-like glycosyltransferase
MKKLGFPIGVIALTLFACIRVASTHRVFSEVLDEPAHLAAGFQWFDGEYRIDPTHPPLARILGALPLRGGDFPRVHGSELVNRGNDLLYHGNRYEKTLARVRIGNVLLLAVACISTAYWARRLTSAAIALLTLALLTTLPAVLGHAGVLTTDVAVLAAIPLALLALDLFLEQPTVRRGAFLGLAIGIGLLAKYSFIVFFPVCAIFAILARKPRRFAWRGALPAAFVAMFVVWGGYRFDFRTAGEYGGNDGLYSFEQASPKIVSKLARRIAESVPIPAPGFFVGLGLLKLHDAVGHDSFLLGETRRDGWWYYFPVVFFYKTPIPYMLLALWGAIAGIAKRERAVMCALLMAAGILGIAMTSSINIGVRHILPLYVPLSLVTAYAVADIRLRSRDAFGRTALAALLVWLFGGVAATHPDYLAWFNELAQPNPAQIAVDSNLDWGQDSLRLVRTLREMQIESPHVDILTNARLANHGVQSIPFDPAQKVTGWLAVSETQLVLKQRFGLYGWLNNYRPVRRIGESIRLYNIPE